MVELIGNLSLALAVLVAVGSILMSIAAAMQASPALLRGARWMVAGFAGAISLAAAMLLIALMTSDFRFTYVAAYTERALPDGYKFAALWAGQEGSLLLWAWLLAILCVLAAIGWRKHFGPEHAIANAALALVEGFFAVLLLFAANPFQIFDAGAPANGRGLNPQLQDIGMIIHPPLLFIGYAGFTMPMAMLVGHLIGWRMRTADGCVRVGGSEHASAQPGARSAIVVSQSPDRWLAHIRKWILLSWMFLGAGIVMGAWWAYVELGWGGYWAWDPVENASLLPWLTATALLHSVIVQQHRGMFRLWNASLIATTFVLCILGTYLTRSGVIDSVHAFSGSLLGTFFLVFLIVAALGSAGLIVWRASRWGGSMLRPQHEMEGLISREGAFLASNVLLVIMMLTTLVGTTFPLLSGMFVEHPVTVKSEFYNRIVAPMGIGLVGLMALAPVLAFGVQAARKIARSLIVPGAAALVIVLFVFTAITHNGWALTCVAITALGTGTVIVDFLRSIKARRQSTGEGLLCCGLRLIDKDHRRYGGQLAHLGVMLIVIGVAGSSLFSTESIHQLKPGESATVGGYTVRYITLKDERRPNHSAVRAELELMESGNASPMPMNPERRFYDAWMEQPSSEVAVRSTWREDVYISLAGWDAGGTVVALQVKINPLVLWIWVGGIVMTLGGLFCMLPRLLPRWEDVAIQENAAVKPLTTQTAPASLEPVGAWRTEVSA